MWLDGVINQLVTRGPHPVPTSSYIQNKSNGAPVELVANNETWTIGFMVDAEWYVEVSINGRTPQSSMLFSDFPWNKPSSYWGYPHDYGNPHMFGWVNINPTSVAPPWNSTIISYIPMCLKPQKIQLETWTGWWFQPSWKILVNGKDYPIYYGK